MARKKTRNYYVLETVQLRQKKKRHQLLHTGNSTTDTDKKRQRLLRTGNSITDTQVIVFLVYFLSTHR